MPFDGDHHDAPLPGLDHPLFAPHEDVELVEGEVNDRLEFSALYSVGDHDFVTGKQPTYYNGNANALRRNVQMAGRAIQLFGTAAWENNQHTILYYPAPPALLNIGTKDFSVLVVYQSDAAGDINHGVNCVTSLANTGGSAGKHLLAFYHNTYNTSDRKLIVETCSSSTQYVLLSAAGHVVHRRAQVGLFTRVNGQTSLWAFGQRLASGANAGSLAGAGDLAVGAMKTADAASPFYGMTGYVHLVSWWSRGMVDAEAAERSANPFAQYRPVPLLVGWRKPGATSYTFTAAAGSFALSGQAAALPYARKTVAATGSFALAGQDAAIKEAHKLAASLGTFEITGINAGLYFGHKAVAAVGAFVLSGQAIRALYARILAMSAGSFTLTGQAVAFNSNIILAASVGAFTVSGIAAALRASRTVALAAGAFTLTGQVASIIRGKVAVADTGVYTLTGNAAGLIATRRISAARGTFTLTGIATVLDWARQVAAGAFSMTGQAATLRAIRYMQASAGAFVVTGIAVTFDYDTLYPGAARPRPVRGGATPRSGGGATTIGGRSSGPATPRN